MQVGDHQWRIFTRHLDSAQPCVVMVHGFTARGAHWFRMARKLPDDRCIVAVDLPGFGSSTFIATAAYDPATQADRLSALLKALPLGNPKVDLIGNSMGGAIIARFALRHPEQTHSLALLNAAGVSSPTLSTLRRDIAAGRNGFFATDIEGFHRFYAMTMSEPPYVPGFIVDAVGEEAIARVPRHQYIFDQLNLDDVLDARLKDIKATDRKVEAKRLAASAGVPLVPGAELGAGVDAASAAAEAPRRPGRIRSRGARLA